MNMIVFTTLIGLLTNQIENWKNHKILGIPFKIILLAFFSSQAFEIGNMFKELPDNLFEQLLTNIHEPIVIICSVILCVFWMVLTCYTVAAAKLMKTLVG